MKFSIIIPCYNVEKYIGECLESVLAQTEQSWEAICTDDGSTDATGKILDEYSLKDSRIRVVHQENKGLSEARNTAMALATGEWLCYLDSDDLYSPWALETYSKLAQQHPNADILRAEMVKFNDGDRPVWGDVAFDSKECDVSNQITMFGLGGYFQQMIYKRDVHGDIPFVGDSWCEERPYVAKCVARAKSVVDCPVQAYTFRVRGGSITQSKMQLKHQKGMLDATKDILTIFQSSGKKIDKYVIRMLLTNWLEWQSRCIMEYLEKDARKEAWKYYFSSMKEASKVRGVTCWRGFTIFVLRYFPFRVFALILCYLPDWFKRKGLHRYLKT